MSQREVTALSTWRAFSENLVVYVRGKPKTWAEYIAGDGYSDEEKVVQPTAFPAFAEQCLNWTLQVNLAPEESGIEGKPDFTPADSVTHPFVFETKSTNKGPKLLGFDEQVARYLKEGAPRIKTVLLTNLVGARVFSLNERAELTEKYAVDLRALLRGPIDSVAKDPEARKLADLFDEFRRKELTPEEKIERVRNAPEWNPAVEVTSSSWILARIDQIVGSLTSNVLAQIRGGKLQDNAVTNADERKSILDELRLLATRLGENNADQLSLDTFINADDSSVRGKALEQFAAHVAYYSVTRLMLIRVWEDLGLLEPMLHDGGFDQQMHRFTGVLRDVVSHSFAKARDRYRSLFDQRNGYTWYEPDADTYVEVIYELANTYLGAIKSDVLGQVYERMLERIDRKLLGVYYTPRDIISLIWDLIGFEAVSDNAENLGHEPRVLDIATGSGGFLVEAAHRLRDRVKRQIHGGASVAIQDWINRVADGLNGVELNRFSAYLAELNLLVQFGQVIADFKELRLPPMSILVGDSLSLHNPVTLFDDWEKAEVPSAIQVDGEDRRERARKLKSPTQADFLMDVACGNPPYIGEKTAARILADTRRDYPYWDSFVGQHMDYLYWFLILGVSKLRKGGRFGFITTEYWLRAAGAKPLRDYLSARCHIERIVLFRDFRLFPDAPGQHSMIITGTRVVEDDGSLEALPSITESKPRVSIYQGSPVSGDKRAAILDSIRDGSSRANVKTFVSLRSPNSLGSESWGDVTLTRSQLEQRDHLKTGDQVSIEVAEGVITTANKLKSATEELLTAGDLAAVGGPGSTAGIQLLTPSEVANLGRLTKKEESVIRLQINTKDVYPYAVVVPTDAPSVVYLAKPDNLNAELSDDQVRATSVPDGLPNIGRHLKRFRSLLQAKTESYGERRPWWSLHRPRYEIVGDAGGGASVWANYCVMARWGVGGTLCVGRAPAGTSPASGLHVLRAENDVVPAGYLTALFNSSLYQEIAESLPPGHLRKADLEAIGVPLRQHHVEQIVAAADKLAELVTTLVRDKSRCFPLVGESLRGNVAMTDPVKHIWLLSTPPTATTGTLTNVNWVDQLSINRAGSTSLGSVRVVEDLFGHQIEVMARGTERVAATITLRTETGHDTAEALGAAIGAIAENGGKVRDLAGVAVPTSPKDLVALYENDCNSLDELVGEYREQRKAIDDALAAML